MSVIEYIPLGIQCPSLVAIDRAKLRHTSYPFDWNIVPVSSSYKIIEILLKRGVKIALKYMTRGYKYYNILGHNKFSLNKLIKTNKFKPTGNKIAQINPLTGICIKHYLINNKYILKLSERLLRLQNKIYSNEKIIFIYADCHSKKDIYMIDEKIWGQMQRNI